VALKALPGSDLTIHAGDIGKLEILDALRSLAPVVAVRGRQARSGSLSSHNLQELARSPAGSNSRRMTGRREGP
jgi:hypothetical protein